MRSEDFAAHLRAGLDALAAAGRHVDLWWRDDDAVEPRSELDDLLATAGRYGVPVALAVIPQPARPELADRLLAADPAVVVFQHGFAHRNFAPKGQKAAELGTHRPVAAVLDELARGNDKLRDMFGPRFLPVLTPPWNRIGDEVARRRSEAGLTGLSTFARMHADDAACVNTHIDPIDWKGNRAFAGYEKLARIFDEEIGRRVAGDGAPIGLLTHHLDHDTRFAGFLDTFLACTVDHPAIRWPAIGDLFRTPGRRQA